MATCNPRKDTDMSPLGFLFVSYIQDLAVKKLQLRNTNRCRPKKLKQNPVSLSKGPGNGLTSWIRNLLYNNHSTLGKYHRNKPWPNFTHTWKGMRSVGFYTHQANTRYPNLPGMCQRRWGMKLGISSPLVVKRTGRTTLKPLV